MGEHVGKAVTVKGARGIFRGYNLAIPGDFMVEFPGTGSWSYDPSDVVFLEPQEVMGMRALIEEYGAAVAARAACAVGIGGGSNLEACKVREREAHDALRAACHIVGQLIGECVTEVEAIANAKPQRYADDPEVVGYGPGSNCDRPHGARRAFTLKDAKPRARAAARRLREAWEMVDPSLAAGPTEADFLAALGPCGK